MKRILAMSLALLVGGCGSKEPLYNGQPLAFWIGCIDISVNPGLRDQSSKLLVDLAPRDKRVVPGLIGQLKKGQFAAADVLARIGPIGDQTKDVVAALAAATGPENKPDVRVQAARALPNFGPAARDALPALFAMLKDPSHLIRIPATEALGKMKWVGKEANGPLLEAIKDPVVDVQIKAREALDNLDPDALRPPKP